MGEGAAVGEVVGVVGGSVAVVDGARVSWGVAAAAAAARPGAVKMTG